MKSKLDISKIATFLIKEYNYILSIDEVARVHREAEIVYKMIKEDVEYFEENGVTYHLSEEVKKYIINKVLI